MRRSAGPETLAGAVRDELGRLGGGSVAGTPITALVERWPEAVGDGIARNAWPARFMRDGTLVVHAASSAWAFELTQLAERILEKLGELAPERVRFVVGPVPEPSRPSGEGVSNERRSAPRPGSEHRQRGAAIAGAIEDPGLRELVARAAASSLARADREAATADPSDTITSA